MRIAPSTQFQLAGLVIYQEQGNATQLGPACAPCTGGSQGQCIDFESYLAGQFAEPNLAAYTGGTALAHLRLRRVGASYTAYCSADGSN